MTGDERLAKVAEVLCQWRAIDTIGGQVHGSPVCVVCKQDAAALIPLLDEFRAEDEARALRAIRAVLDNSCHHCGIGPDDDGDHSCPCPNTDSECLEHLEYPVQPTNLRAALTAAEPDGGER